MAVFTPSANDERSKEDSAASRHREPIVPDIPDGGLQAWLTVVGSWLVSCVTFGYMNAYGVYNAYYVETLLPSYSPSAISWIGSVQMCLLFSVAMVSGKLFDQGHFRPLVITGSILFVGCIFAQSAAQPDAYYQLFLSQGVGQGIGQGLIYIPSLGVIAHYFRKRRALVMGVIVMGSSVGGIIFPILLNNLLVKSGYKWTVRAAGFLILGCLLIANLLMSTRLSPANGKDRAKIGKFLKDPPYVFAIAGIFLVFWGVCLPLFYIQLYATHQGISPTLTFYTLSIVNAASAFGRTLPNLFADKAGPTTLIIPCSVATGVIIFALIGCTHQGAIIAFCVLFGFFSGAYIGLTAPMLAHMADNVSEIGARMGIGMGMMGLASLTGTPIDGALLGSGPDYTWWKAVVFSGIAVFGGSASLSVSWYLLRKKKAQALV